jgi:hypothetical protein
MNRLRLLLIILLASGYCAGHVLADEDAVTMYVEDTSPALRLHNNFDGGTSARVVFQAGDDAANYVIIVGPGGTVSNAITGMDGAIDTIAEIAPLLEACTNTAGEKKLTVDYDCSLAADSTNAELLDSTDVTVQSGDWGEIALWDTTDSDFFSCYIPGGSVGGQDCKKIITRIYGNIVGTGNVTVNIYVDGVEKFERVFVSPVFVQGDSTADDNDDEHASDSVGPGQVNIPINFPAQPSENVLIRASRGTAATSGSLAAFIDYKY